MADESTALAESDQSPITKIQRGAALDENQWPQERVAAVVKMLPEDFRTPTNAIALFERAVPAGLNPLSDEIWAWKQSGQLQFMVSRDGWLKIADRDPKVTGLEFGHVYSEDEFWFETGDEIDVHHKGGMKRGELVGAYCVIHHEEGDHIERRLIEDYKHLQRKKVWKENEQEMLLTRVISTCVRLKCPEAAGLQAEGGMALDEAPKRQRAEQAAQEATEDEADRLAAELAAEEEASSNGDEIEAEATEVTDEGKAEASSEDESDGTTSESSTKSDLEPDTIEQTVDASEAEGKATATSSESPSNSEAPSSEGSSEMVEHVTCPICTEEVAKSSYPGHKGGHTRSGYTLPDGVDQIGRGDDGLFDVIATGGGAVIGGFDSWEAAVQAANNWANGSDQSEPIEPDAIDQPDAFDDQSESDQEPGADAGDDQSDDQPERSWDDLYGEVMAFASDHPDGLSFVRSTATDLFSDRVDLNDQGHVPISQLDLLQLGELRSELEAELSEAEF